MTMDTVNIATLKEKLSYYLKLVQRGQEIVVTSHRHQVARIVPVVPRRYPRSGSLYGRLKIFLC